MLPRFRTKWVHGHSLYPAIDGAVVEPMPVSLLGHAAVGKTSWPGCAFSKPATVMLAKEILVRLLPLRRATLYPAELRVLRRFIYPIGRAGATALAGVGAAKVERRGPAFPMQNSDSFLPFSASLAVLIFSPSMGTSDV
jgi:hypothetical protein